MQEQDVLFLTLAEVMDIHTDQVERYGGSTGIRDTDLLSSAVAMPYASFGDKFLHAGIFEMAAVYVYHIAQNHPFIDGNKRAALASALVFLEMNGITISDKEDKLYEAMISIATGKMNKVEFAEILRALV